MALVGGWGKIPWLWRQGRRADQLKFWMYAGTLRATAVNKAHMEFDRNT